MARSVSATEARRHLERLLREVEQTKCRIVVTRYGKPMIVIRPLEEAEADAEGPPQAAHETA